MTADGRLGLDADCWVHAPSGPCRRNIKLVCQLCLASGRWSYGSNEIQLLQVDWDH